MRKIHRLGWAEGTCIESYGLKIGIRANQPGALEQLAPFLPPQWGAIDPPRKLDTLYSWVIGGERRPNVRTFEVLYSGAGRIARTQQRKELFEAFESDLRLNVALLSPRFVFIHAGAVGWQGRATLIPGRTFTGKSRLVEALVRAGADYLSDEFAVLDSSGRVHPFPKPITLRTDGLNGQKAVRLDDIGGRMAERPLKLGAILATKYKQSGKPRFRQTSRGQGAMALLANAVAARWTPARVLRSVCKATEGAVVLRGTRGEAADAAEQLLELLNNPQKAHNQSFTGGLHGITRESELAAEGEARRLAG